MDNIALDIAQYLDDVGEGTIGADIFAGVLPGTPDNAVAVYDTQGPAPLEPPNDWRELTLKVRDSSQTDGYDRVWRVLNCLLYPAAGQIVVGDNRYNVQLEQMPSVLETDASGRYVFSFQAAVYGVVDPSAVDPWLDALASWAQNILGSGWTMYRTWPGNRRPSVHWCVTEYEVREKGGAFFEVRKKVSGRVLGSTPNEQAAGTFTLVEKLGGMSKLVLDGFNRRYLTVSQPTAQGSLMNYPAASVPEVNTRQDALTAGKVSVVLSRLTKRPSEEAPLMMAVNHRGQFVV
ncbi:MAG: hypothetical protein HPY50_04965 [Firmicutes bacterium]|nr:hypothetical protein [Bacillota bacterium]